LFSELVRNPYAIREKLSSTSNPDKYITPLDVVKVEKRTAGIDYDHVGIYLGDNYVCHIAGTPSDKRGVRIHSWSTFLEGARENPVRYHPIIPFKHHEKISKQIAWAAMNEYREGQYQVLKKNCEHFANMVVFGFEHSHQGHSHQEFLKNHMRNSINVFFPFFPVPLEGSGIESEEEKKVKLVDEINRTNSQLGESTSGWYSNIENKIEIPPKRCSVM
jgi:hypothetical protein